MRSRLEAILFPFVGMPEFDRPRFVPVIFASVVVGTAFGVVVQRFGHVPIRPVIGLAALAIAPLIGNVFGRDAGWIVGIACADVGVYFLLRWSAMPFDLSPFLLLIALAVTGLARPLMPGLISLASAMAVPASLELFGDFTGSVTWAIGMTAAFAAAHAVRHLSLALSELSIAQRDLAERAATDERRRIAAELHDLIAHSLAVTMLHLTGARLALATDDRAEAMEALAEAEQTGRATLADVRRTVGLLADGASTQPALPDARAIPELVDGFRIAGLAAQLDVAGELGDVDRPTGLALYRLTQEALANVARHAPGAAAAVTLRIGPREVAFTVTNSAADAVADHSGAGHGVRGMRERIDALGGTFIAGPQDGAWVVRALIPR